MSILIFKNDELKNFEKNLEDKYFDKFSKITLNLFWFFKEFDKKINLPFSFVLSNEKLYNFVVEKIFFQTFEISLELKDYQKNFLERELIKNPNKHVLHSWNLPLGSGKTFMAMAAIQFYNKYTVVIVNNKKLREQWIFEIKKFLPDYKIDVVMISQIGKFSLNEIVIMDECHNLITRGSLEKIKNIFPKVLIALSGTFERDDKYQFYFNLIFGKPTVFDFDSDKMYNKKITRKLFVDIVKTKIIPTCESTKNCNINYNKLLLDLSQNDYRNQIIVEHVLKNSDKKILLLTKFVKHGQILENMIKNKNPNLEIVNLFTCKDFNKPNIIISSPKKMGTGISIQWLNCLIIALDVLAKCSQVYGRVLRSENSNANIICFLDNHYIFKNHLKKQVKELEKLNALIKFN